MMTRLFPAQIDNRYRGYRLALWLFVPILFVDLVMGINTMIHTRDVIQGADAIPLDSYGVTPARIIVQCFKSWALCLALMSSLGVLALIRYRAMVPLTYLLLALENGGRRALQLAYPVHPGAHAGRLSVGGWINLSLLTALIVGFLLSLGGWSRAREKRDASS